MIDITSPKIFIAKREGIGEFGRREKYYSEACIRLGMNPRLTDPHVFTCGQLWGSRSRRRVIFIGIRKSALKVKALRALQEENLPKAYDPLSRSDMLAPWKIRDYCRR